MIEALLACVAESRLAEWVRVSRWGYAGLSAAHVFGIALLVGAVVPLNLQRLGAFGGIGQADLARVLVPTAGAGLVLATLTGSLLLMPGVADYLALWVVRAKLALVAVGVIHAALLHARYGWWMERAGATRLGVHAGLSLAVWIAVLVLGRAIAFV